MNVFNGILLIIGVIGAGFLTVLWAKYRNSFDDYIDPLDGNDYFLKEFFFIGYGFTTLFSIRFAGKWYTDRVKKMTELYGSRYAQFYAVSNVTAQITYAILAFPVLCLLSVIGDSMWILLLGLLLIILLIYYVDMDNDSKINKKREQILRDFPHVLSKMALLVNAGMPIRETVAVIANNSEGVLYDELRNVLLEMENGMSDYEAFYHLSDSSGVQEVKKLSSVITQNIKKGSSGLSAELMQMSNEVWGDRVRHVKEIGEKASIKLMAPMLIIFVGILLMVIAPMLSGLS